MLYDKLKLLQNAPGINLIPLILDGDERAFREFYAKRTRTFTHPNLSHRMFSYSIFSDLILQLPTDLYHKYLPVVISLALKEEPKYLVCALSLINDFDSGFTSSNKEQIKADLKALYPKIKKYNPYFHYTSYWQQICLNFFHPAERTEWQLSYEHYATLLPTAYKQVDDLGAASDPDHAMSAKHLVAEIEDDLEHEDLKGTTLSFESSFNYLHMNFWFYKIKNPNVLGLVDRDIYTVKNNQNPGYRVYQCFINSDREVTQQDIVADYIYTKMDYES